MKVHADLHIHGPYSMGTSKNMQFPILATEGKKKGLQLIATGDCLHEKWLTLIKQMKDLGNGFLEMDGMNFIVNTEVEDSDRVHHLLYFPEVSKAEEFREIAIRRSPNMDRDGRPNLYMNGEEIAQLAKDCEALVGPAHAFTPWTALYAAHGSLEECYGDMADYVSFLELGLSANTAYSDRISDHHRLTYLTNSDSHSPYITRIAREFNVLELTELSFDNLKKAILREGGQKFVLNVGFPPQLGKYNQSACISCFKRYSLRDAKIKNWRCACGKTVKKGVEDRINELADLEAPQHPEYRPSYLHLLPLSKIVSRAMGMKSETSKKVVANWNALAERFGSEIEVLLNGEYREIEKLTNPEVARAVRLFRSGKIPLIPGGGGLYGDIDLSSGAVAEDGGLYAFDAVKQKASLPEEDEGDSKGKQTTLF